MADGRVQLILILAFLYLVQGILRSYFPQNMSPAETAALRSGPSGQLVVETRTAPDPEANEHDIPAAHAPFLFQAIPINSADKETLMTVQGIGPTLAEAIIRYRQQFGVFHNIEELSNVPGVGVKRAVSLSPFLRLGEAR